MFSEKGKADMKRTNIQAQQSVATIMCVVLTMLMNAVEKGHEEETFDNEPMCMAIMDILSKDNFSQHLMALFFKRKVGYDGKKVVIAPYDPMSQDSTLADMDDTAKAELDEMVAVVIRKTQTLQTLFKGYCDKWTAIWKDICLDTELMGLLKDVNPRGNEWGMNMKMVLNVIGLFKNMTKSDVSDKSINDQLSNKNLRTYIAQHADFDGTNSAFTHEQHTRVKTIIEKHIFNNNR
jgi:hypothetical protein